MQPDELWHCGRERTFFSIGLMNSMRVLDFTEIFLVVSSKLTQQHPQTPASFKVDEKFCSCVNLRTCLSAFLEWGLNTYKYRWLFSRPRKGQVTTNSQLYSYQNFTPVYHTV